MTGVSIGRCLAQLRRDRRGAAALLVALMMVPLLLALGGAIDFGIAYYIKNRLGHAVDSAALAVGSTVEDAVDVTERAGDFIAANYPAGVMGWVHDVSVTVTNDIVTVAAKASFDTHFLKLFQWDRITVSADAEVIRSIKGLELAMVLDNTGSMRGGNNIGALRIAAEDMVDILFGHETEHPYLYISIVPYAASVNPGPEALGGSTNPPDPSWWPEPGDPHYVPFEWTADGTGQGWKGCVMERTGADLLGDDSATGWTPFVYESGPANDYDPDDMPGTVRYNPTTYQNSGTGPNLGCPSPIIPLTNRKGDLVDVIRGLDAWHRGGTMADLGLAWGRRALSPEAPFTEGKAWDEPRWEKAIVMMTDGENQFYRLDKDKWPPNEPDPSVNSDYSGIGWLSSSNPLIGTNSKSTANDIIDARMALACEDIKAQGIIVYTVTFSSSINQATKDLYRDCASDPAKWFDSPSQEDLKASFRAIAIELSRLRVSQ